MSEELLTVKELAEVLKVKKSWVYGKSRQRGSNAIPMIRAGKYCRFRLEKVLEWLERKGDEARL